MKKKDIEKEDSSIEKTIEQSDEDVSGESMGDDLCKSVTISLEESLGIAQVEAFHQRLLSILNSTTDEDIEIDPCELQQIDAAGVQLIYAFIHDAEGRGLKVSWRSTSEAFEKSARQIGLAGLTEVS